MTQTTGSRFAQALMRLRDGRCFYHRGVNVWLAPDGYLEVRVHTDWRVEKTGEQGSLDDLDFARCVVDEMIGSSPDLAALISDRPWRFVRINDRETGTTSVYHLRDGLVAWSISLL